MDHSVHAHEMIRATFHKGLSTNTSGNCPGFPEGSCVRPARTSTELDNQSPQGGAPAARAPRALPSLAAFRGGLPPLNLPAAITRRTPRKGMGPMGDRERNPTAGGSGKDQVPADLSRTPREPGGEARGRRPQPCRSKAKARAWRGGPRNTYRGQAVAAPLGAVPDFVSGKSAGSAEPND